MPVNLTDAYDRVAEQSTAAQQLGLSQAAYEELMIREADWALEDPSKRSLISPLEQQQEENAELQADLGMDDVEFADLMKRQSEWAEQVELSKSDPDIAFSKSSPVELARMMAGLIDVQPTTALKPSDFVIK